MSENNAFTTVFWEFGLGSGYGGQAAVDSFFACGTCGATVAEATANSVTNRAKHDAWHKAGK